MRSVLTAQRAKLMLQHTDLFNRYDDAERQSNITLTVLFLLLQSYEVKVVQPFSSAQCPGLV